MKLTKKIIAVFLSILTLFSICSTSTTVFASEYTEQKVRTEYFNSALSGYLKNIVDMEDAVSISEKELVDETVEKVNSSVVRTASTFSLRATPTQSTETAKEAADDLNIDHTRLTLELEDGENVAYLFSEPISFIDDEGNLVYKDTNIKAVTDSIILNRGYSYENGSNDYKAYFSEDSARGLLLVDKDGEEVRLVPNGTKVVGTLGKVESDMKLVDSFEYNGVYGTDTVLRFLPQLNGCKEEIVLSSYQGISDFSFILYTQNGTIAAINSNGEVEIINAATKDIITTFVAPFANDSSGGLDVTSEHYTDCTYELEMIAEGKYILTISVPKEYLESENTVYPVIIDPTTDNISMYLDTSVYSALSDEPQGSNPTACFGKTDTSEYGKGRAMFYFKLPTDIKNYAQISSAKFWLRETTGRTAEMYVRPYLISESWTNQVTWDTQPKYYNGTADYPGKSNFSLPRRNINSASTDDPESPYWYAFNIVYAVRAWTTGTTNLGLKFIAECEAADGDYLWRAFATKDHSTSSYRPYVVISYTNDTTAPTFTVSGNPTEWTKDNVTLTVTATDNVYGANGIAGYSFDNGESWQTGKTKTFSKNQTVYIKVKDKAGNISAATTVKITKIDKTAPTISKVALSPTSWTNGNVKVTVTASDSASGLASKAYSFDNGSTWQTNNYKSYSANNSSINVKVRDTLGNVSIYESNPVKITKIDKAAPSATITISPTTVTNGSVTATIKMTDNSALASYTLDGASAVTISGTSKSITKTYSKNQTISLMVKDAAGNSYTTTKDITNIDKTKPSVTITLSPTSWTSGSVTATIKMTDNVGLKSYSLDGATAVSISGTSKTITKTYTVNDTIDITVTDTAGNSVTASKSFTNIDKTKPSATITLSPTSWTNGSVTATIKMTDNAALASYTLDGASAVTISGTSKSITKTYSANETISLTVKDAAGNTYTTSKSITNIDKTKPSATISLSPTTATNGNVTATIKITDNAALASYTLDDASAVTISGTSKTITKTYSANETISLTVKDAAGNSYTTTKDITNIDKIKPSATITLSSTSWTNGSVTATIKMTDNVGLKSYSLDGATAVSISGTSKTITKTYTVNDTIDITVTDTAGNSVTASKSFTNIDKTNPSATITLSPTSWTNGSVTATIKMTDNAALASYTLDGASAVTISGTSKTITKTYSANETISLTVKDATNNTYTTSKSITNIDKTKPSAIITLTPDTWTKGDVTATIQMTDNAALASYTLDGASAVTISGTSKTITKTYSKNQTISVTVKDQAGNSYSAEKKITNIDKSAPVVTVLSETTSVSSKITVNASDAGAGLHETAYCYNDGDWTSDNFLYVTDNSEVTIKVRDILGNIYTTTHTPEEKPEINVSVEPQCWTRDDATVTVNGTGLTKYSFDNGESWQNGNVLSVSENGNIIINVTDVFGNTMYVGDYEIDVIDKLSPEIIDVNVSEITWTYKPVTVTVTAIDEDSGIYEYSFDGGESWQTENVKTFNKNEDEIYPETVLVMVKDTAGNTTQWDEISLVPVDVEVPASPDLYEQDGLVYISSRSFDFNEDTDSAENVEYSLDGTNWSSYEEPLNIVRTYGATVYARVVDAAHNGEDGSNVTSITLENNLGEYTASYTDIALGEGLFPVEFGRTYTSTNGWFFSFDANVVKIDDNAYVFTDFYGEKQYFIKNSEGKYLSIDDEELTINADSYVLTYGDMTCTFGSDGKIKHITTDYLDTVYTWNDNGTLTITGGATVTFTDGKPTEINITREGQVKEVEYIWTDGNLTKFIDAADVEHNYAYTNGLLTTNDTETITYSAQGRVKLISQPNGAFVKYIYNDSATNAEAPNNVGAVTVSDSKGVTDTWYYADGVYISNTLGSYSDNAVYAPESISNALTQDSLVDVVYVVEEPQEDESADGTDVETGETETEEPEDTENEPEYTYDENGNVLTETYSSTVDGQNVIVDQYIYTYTEDNKLTTEKYYAADESNVLCLVSEYVYDADENIISELYYTQETVDEEKVDVISECYTREYSGENMTSEIYKKRVDGELANQEKTVYSYDDKGNVVNESVCQWLVNTWYQTYCEEYTYDNYGNALSQTTSEYKNTVNAETGLVETTSDIVTVTYEYDVWNQQVKVTENINATENTITTVVYDALGRVVSVAEDDEITAYTYDSKDNILTVTEGEEITTYTYSDNGNLVSRINPNGTVASYVYDSYGNLTDHAFNGYAFTYNTLGSILTANSESGQLVNYTYSSTVEQDVLNANFGNGQSIVYDYNEDGEITAIKLGEVTKYGYKYLETTDENGEVTKEWAELTDYVSGIKKVIEESKLTVNDLNGNFIYSIENVSKDEEVEDSFNGTVTTIGSDVYTLVTEENKDTFKTNGTTDFTKEYTYVNDELNKTYTAGITTSYGYNAENFISILENTLNDVSQVYGYAYDDNGNITTETLTTTSKDENGATVETDEAIHYTYDDKEQLISAETSSIKYEYTYDDRGNILTKKEYSISLDENNQKVYTLIEANTDTYAYDETWKDKLISYNGQSITYDAVGNPTNYMGNELTWTMGRQLATFGDISYTYNEDGIRTSKTVNSVKTTFLLNGYNIIEQTDGTITLHFFYDSNNEVIGFRYNGNDYFYVKNAMSDIIAITDSNKNIVVEYRYDPWGDILSTSGDMVIGNLNPFRYRSYYYDSDIEMYYLQSRYYDAEVGRFINCDDVNYIGVTESEVSYNPFAYCNNSPVNDSDLNGHFSWKQVTAIFNEIIDDAELLLAKFYRKYHKSRKAFAKMTKYKKADKVYEFVYKNSSKIKKFGKTISGIGTFLSILLAISEVSEIINKGKSYKRMILHIVYCGGLRFAQCVSEEIIPYIVGTICQPLIVLNYAVKRIVTYAFTIFENSKYNETINTNFINYLMNRDFTPDNVIRALFYGVKYCFC